GDRILSDVERVARDNPWAVIAGGVVLGFAASRFLKASSRKRFESSSEFDRYRTPQIPQRSGMTTGGMSEADRTGRVTTPGMPAGAGVGTGSPSTASPVGSL
ncbi:MAG TPA: hypothetical protein VFR97_08265, partial [Capillimicrobium sp.]|nr:hypothetical protein [Capillimicrobium sp.]